MTTKSHVVLADIHYPEHDAKALKVVFEFIRKNKKRIASVTLLGDALDCANLSRHTKGKPRLRNPRYNIAPTQPVPAIRQHPKEPVRQISTMRWGLTPSWSKVTSGAAKMINARSETAHAACIP